VVKKNLKYSKIWSSSVFEKIQKSEFKYMRNFKYNNWVRMLKNYPVYYIGYTSI